MLTLSVGARLRLPVADLDEDVRQELRELFEHGNPNHFRQKATQGWSREPAEVATWAPEYGEDTELAALTFPRGGLRRVRFVLERHGLDWDEDDSGLSDGDATIRPYTGDYLTPQLLPDPTIIPWEHQERMNQAIQERECALVLAAKGCIAGHARIGINRGGKGWSLPIADLVRMQNGGLARTSRWDLGIPTLVRARMNDGTVRLVRLVAAYESGVKPTLRMRTETGHVLEATADHRILTVDGWRRLGQLVVGDSVFVERSNRPAKAATRKRKSLYVNVGNLVHHPYASSPGCKRGGWVVPRHRVVVEAALNSLPYKDFVARCRSGGVDGLTFLNPKQFVVHHLDEDSRNDVLDNLAVVTHRGHSKTHAAASLASIAVRTELSRIVAIEGAGMQATYDLQLEAPHNFIADGVVVHNSGKTRGVLLAIRAANLPAVIGVWERNLLTQWVEDIQEVFGLGPDDVGLIQGKKRKLRPITLAMQQTLNQMPSPERTALLARFGFFAGDEIQRAAATTFTGTIDDAPCRFRVGVSGGIRRKDGKQFLITDLFGDPAIEVTQREMVDAGIVHDVECVVAPTQFEAPWYAEQQAAKVMPDFNRLLDELTTDRDRNALVARLVVERAAEPRRRCLVFTHRVAHAVLLREMLASLGVPAGLMLGRDERRAEFEQTKARLKSGELLVGVGTYMAMGVGQNLPAVEVGLAGTPVMDKEYLGQVTARCNRRATGKDSAEVIVPWDRYAFEDDGMLRRLARWHTKCGVLTSTGAMIAPAQYLRDQPRKAADHETQRGRSGAAGAAGIFIDAPRGAAPRRQGARRR